MTRKLLLLSLLCAATLASAQKIVGGPFVTMQVPRTATIVWIVQDSQVTVTPKAGFGAVKRIRPKIMTVATILVGLVPILWSQGTGADVMKRIAAPMVGGVVTSALLELIVYPALYLIWKGRGLPQGAAR